MVFGLDGDGHADVGEVFLEGDDVLVAEADTALAGASGDSVLVVGAAVDADAAVSRRFQTQEPVTVGEDISATIFKVMLPS